MPSIFAPTDAPCGIFGPSLCAGGTLKEVTFVRAAHLVASAAPTQNSSGEVVLSFVAIGPYVLDWQWQPAGAMRQIHGIVVEVAAWATAGPGVDLQTLDRGTVDNRRVECITTMPWGTHTEWEFKELGR